MPVELSGIEWTVSTWNPWTGCTRVSPGCKHCYAEAYALRLKAAGLKSYETGFGITLRPERLSQPLRWQEPRLVFVNSMSDFWHEDVPDEFRIKCLEVMAKADHHIYQILTKRPQRMLEFYRNHPKHFGSDKAHLWLGVSVETQQYVERIKVLTQVPAAVHFISFEPLLGPIREWDTDGVEWVIVGGESGRHIRPGADNPRALVRYANGRWLPKPEAVEWVRAIRDRAKRAGIAFFFKQWGGPTPKSGGNMLDGRRWFEMPNARSESILQRKLTRD